MKSSLSLSYLDYLEKNKNRLCVNFIPQAYQDYIRYNAPKVEFGDIGWVNRNWNLFVPEYNVNLRYKAVYNYMQRYLWGILASIITYFVDFGYQPSIDRLKASGIFNALFLENYLVTKEVKALDARGIQIADLFHNKGDQIFNYFKACVQDLVLESRKAVQIEGDIKDLNPKLGLFEQFARDTLKLINDTRTPGISFENVEGIIDDFNGNLDDVYAKVKRFFELYDTFRANSEVTDKSKKDFNGIFPDLNTNGTFNEFLAALYEKVRALDEENRKMKKDNEVYRTVNQEFTNVMNEIADKLKLSNMEEASASSVPHSKEQYIDAIKSLQDQASGFKDKQRQIYEGLTEITHNKDMSEWLPSSSITDFEPQIKNVITVLRDEVVEKQRKIEELNAEVLQYKSKEFTAQQVEQEAKKAKKEKKTAQEKELGKIREEKAKMEGELRKLQEELQTNKEKLFTVQSTVKSNETEIKRIQRLLNESREKYENKVQAYNDLFALRQRISEQLDLTNKELNGLKNSDRSKDVTIAGLQEKLTKLEEAKTELEQEKGDKMIEIKQLEAKMEELSREKVELEKQVGVLTEDNQNKQKEIIRLNTANQGLQKAIAEYESRIDINAKRISELEETNAQLKNQSTALQSENLHLQSNLEQAKEQASFLQYENMEEKSANRQLESELNQAKGQAAKVENELAIITQKLEKSRLKRILKQTDENMQEVEKKPVVVESTFKEDDATDLIPTLKRPRKAFYEKIYDIINLLGELFNLPPFDIKGDPLFDEGSNAQAVRRLFYDTYKGIIPELNENVIKYADITDLYVGDIFNRYWNAGIKLDPDRDNIRWGKPPPEWTGEDQMTWICFRTYVAYAMFNIIKVGHFRPNYISTAMFKRIYMIYDDLVNSVGMINISTMSNIMFILYLYISWNKNILRINDISILLKYYNPKKGPRDLTEISPFGYFLGDLLAFKKYKKVDAVRMNQFNLPDDPYIRFMRELNYGSLHDGAIQEERLPDIRLENADPLFLKIIGYINEGAKRHIANLEQHDFTIVGAGTIRLDKSRDIINSLKRSIIKPIIGVNTNDIAIYPVRGLHKDSSMEELTNNVFICMNKRTGNYRVILLNKQGEYAISYPGNSFTNPLMPYDLYLSPQKRNEVIIVNSTDAVPSYYIRLDTQYKDNKVIDNDDLLNSLFPKVEMRNISLRELLEYMIPPQHVIVNGVGSGVITSRDIVNTFITPID